MSTPAATIEELRDQIVEEPTQGYRQVTHKFMNEHGRRISLEVRAIYVKPVGGVYAVRVLASGPDSEVDHLWTQVEAEALRDALTDALGYSAQAAAVRENAAAIAEAWIKRGSPDIELLPTAIRSMSITSARATEG